MTGFTAPAAIAATRDDTAVVAPGQGVAILGHPRGRPPPASPRRARTAAESCDPRSPARATATTRQRSRSTSSSGCDPRSPARATATASVTGSAAFVLGVAILGHPRGRPPPSDGRLARTHARLRSSVTREGDRHLPRATATSVGRWLRSSVTREGDRHVCLHDSTLDRTTLRSSVTREGDRHPLASHRAAAAGEVAILGHPRGRPPLVLDRPQPVQELVAILGHPRGRPPPLLDLRQEHSAR